MIFLLIAVIIAILDLGIRRYVETYENDGKGRLILRKRIRLQKLENGGTAFGKLEEKRELLTKLVCVTFFLSLIRFLILLLKKGRTLTKLGMAMIMGGGAANLHDRMKKGSVTDYLSFESKWKALSTIVFNLADVFILIVSVLILIAEKCGDKD